MEVEKRKNKRVMREEDEQNESERVNFRKLKGHQDEEEEDGVPTEEEVEEFFAILRRMRVAVKYFDHKGRGGREWREALETAEVAVHHGRDDAGVGQEDDDDKAMKKGAEEIINEGFDLNAVAPEAADGGGA